ncbi:uncharacterized protein G2W53_004068 [Senna tora]|uniref:Uncharacterized protein n=1 Tax=Senna tora TaxID=362788 RepID=A0A835CJ05_9FABA|nr:uncharacterized protein G2W53_004068 [Senna tora]
MAMVRRSRTVPDLGVGMLKASLNQMPRQQST